jgi:hypothetical protein
MIKGMVDRFRQAKYNPTIASMMAYDEETLFTENNIQQYLGELEELITKLITRVASTRGDPNAPIAAMNMSKLNEKVFERRSLKVDIPNYQ